MKYRIFIYTDPALFRESCRMMAAFLRDHALDPADGKTVLIGEELPENAELLLPTKTAIYVKEDPLDSEEILQSVLPLCSEKLNLFHPDLYSEELAVRLSVRCGGTSMTDVTRLSWVGGFLQIRRPVYGGHVNGTFLMKDAPYFICLNRGLGEAEPVSGTIDARQATQRNRGTVSSDRVLSYEEKDSDLEEADFVIIGGRGLKGSGGALKLSEYAAALSASVGCTRPVVMSAWMPRSRLVGVSGVMIHPDLCIVCAASGSPAFYEGIRKSKVIIAVNTDQRAPIMKKSDVCVCADWREVLLELTNKTTGGF